MIQVNFNIVSLKKRFFYIKTSICEEKISDLENNQIRKLKLKKVGF